jgi:hypothetical protein
VGVLSDSNFVLLDWLPSPTLNRSLGTGANRWLNLFVSQVNGEDGSFIGDVNALRFFQNTNEVCDASGNCPTTTDTNCALTNSCPNVLYQVDANTWFVKQVDGNIWYVKNSDVNNLRMDYGVIANPPWLTSYIDTNWQTSWDLFDANMQATYPIKADVNTWGDARYLPIGTSFTDTNWQTSWNVFDTNMKTYYLQTVTNPLVLPELDSGKYLSNNGSILSWSTVSTVDTNWQTSWPTFDANMVAQYRKYSVDLNTSQNINSDKNINATSYINIGTKGYIYDDGNSLIIGRRT